MPERSHDESEAFRHLDPDTLLSAVESVGYACDGHALALNSYENRVYQVGVEDGPTIIAKFYRPGRWSDAAIIEEHLFSLELAEAEIPVVAPLAVGATTLHRHGPFRFTLYPRRGGRAPEFDRPDHLRQLGRLIARIHNVGATQPFAHRPTLDIEHFGIDAYHYLLAHGFIPAALETAYRSLAEDLIAAIREIFAMVSPVRHLRLHGDCHAGNILWRDEQAHIVDFDDARNGPAIQDLWMFLSGDGAYMNERVRDLLDAYTEFRAFDARELHLIEPLRTLRMMHFSAWIARRWDDPAFPRAFPAFAGARYWEDHILALREQAALLNEAPPSWR